MKATLAQLKPERRAVEANVRTASGVVAQHSDSDLVIFPETYLCGYDLDVMEELAITPEAVELAPLRSACADARTAAIVGFAEALPGGGVANSALCIGEGGEVVHVYRKTHLFGRERIAFVPGDSLAPVALAGRRIGLMICYDMEFPEVARTLAKRGADTLVAISANWYPLGPDHSTATRARALENGLPLLYVNLIGEEDGLLLGEEDGLRFVGESRVVDPEGMVLEEAGDQPQLLSATVPEGSERSRPELRYLNFLREDLYEHR
jgi:predicted amidohydrolase